MEWLNSFHFLRPAWLLLWPLAWLLLWRWSRSTGHHGWQRLCDAHLLPHVLIHPAHSRRRALAVPLLATLLLSLTLAGPSWQQQEQPLYRAPSALVVLLDLSPSMKAADLKPSRLMQARLKLADLLRQRREGLTALVVFGAEAFTVVPLTEDSHTIETLLPSLEPGLMPVAGSSPSRAIERGVELLHQAGMTQGTLLLISDEDAPQSALAAARAARQQDVRLHVLMIGTEEGAPVPQVGGDFVKDASGQMVLARPAVAGLQQLAEAGGGRAMALTVDNRDLDLLLGNLNASALEGAQPESGAVGTLWRDEGVWLLWPLAFLAALLFRRGLLFVLVLILLQLAPRPALALEWPQLWRNRNQQGARSFAGGDYAAATGQFDDWRWQGASLYRAGHYGEAAQAWQAAENAHDWYNLGNALARDGQLLQALAAYDEALRRDPGLTVARENRELVEKQLNQQQQQEKEKQRQPGGGKDGEQNDNRGSDGASDGSDKKGTGDSTTGNAESDDASPQDAPKPDQKSSSGAGNPSSQSGDAATSSEDGRRPDAEERSAEPNEAEKNRDSANGTASSRPEAPGEQAAAPDVQTAEDGQAGQDDSGLQQSPAAALSPPTPSAGQEPTSSDETAAVSTGGADAQDEPLSDEERQRLQQLRSIQDDPGLLLRRKFLYQYRQRDNRAVEEKKW